MSRLGLEVFGGGEEPNMNRFEGGVASLRALFDKSERSCSISEAEVGLL